MRETSVHLPLSLLPVRPSNHLTILTSVNNAQAAVSSPPFSPSIFALQVSDGKVGEASVYTCLEGTARQSAAAERTRVCESKNKAASASKMCNVLKSSKIRAAIAVTPSRLHNICTL